MMNNDSSRTTLALVLALLMATPALAAQQVEQPSVEGVGQKVAQEADSLTEELKTEANTEVGEVAPELGSVAVDGEPLVGEGDPLPDPEEVLKTKTKSNQSND